MTARHAATDGSFGRSAGGAAARGAGLLIVAIVLGILLLRSGGGDPYSQAVQTGATGPVQTTPVPTATTITVPVRNPGDIKIVPANGTGTAGAGTNAGARLKAAGYNVLGATNTTKQATTSNVYYVTGYEREAQVVARLLGLPDSAAQTMPSPPPVPDVRDAHLVVVVGPDLARQAPPATSAPGGTSTTRRSTATTARTATSAGGATTTSR